MELTAIIVILVYLIVIGFLGFKGYRETKTSADYMVGGRKIHPFIMALSYGATFISTSALVGFAGIAGLFGMSLLWLTFLNIFVGIFIAFVFFGKRTRQMGHNLDAHTFPEFLGRRYQSRFIQGFGGLIIFVFMPLYAAAVLIGAAHLIEQQLLQPGQYHVALFIFAIIVTAYVIFGGLKGTMYTDALQGSIMFIGVVILLVVGYGNLGGVTKAHERLGAVPEKIEAAYTALKQDLGEEKFALVAGAVYKKAVPTEGVIASNASVTGVSTEYSARFTHTTTHPVVKGENTLTLTYTNEFVRLVNPTLYTVSKGEGKTAMVGVAGVETVTTVTTEEKNVSASEEGEYVLTNTHAAVYQGEGIVFSKDEYETMKATLLNSRVVSLATAKEHGLGVIIPPVFKGWTKMPGAGSPLWLVIITTITLGVGIGVLAQPQLAVRFMTVKSNRELNRAVLIGGIFIIAMTGGVFVVGSLSNALFYEKTGKIAMVIAGFNTDKVIPTFIKTALPSWFGYIFVLTILAAGMSTLSSQFHAMGTSIGRDVYEMWINKGEQNKNSVLITRVGVFLTVVLAVILGYNLPKGYIARATAIFFGLTAASFLPAYIGALYWKSATRAGAIASMVTGFIVSGVWLAFFQKKEATALGICNALFGKTHLTTGLWQFTDALVFALPTSIIVFVVVSVLTKKPEDRHLTNVFKKI